MNESLTGMRNACSATSTRKRNIVVLHFSQDHMLLLLLVKCSALLIRNICNWLSLIFFFFVKLRRVEQQYARAIFFSFTHRLFFRVKKECWCSVERWAARTRLTSLQLELPRVAARADASLYIYYYSHSVIHSLICDADSACAPHCPVRQCRWYSRFFEGGETWRTRDSGEHLCVCVSVGFAARA